MISRFRINYRQGYLARIASRRCERKAARRDAQAKGNINNPIHEPSNVSHVFIHEEFDSFGEGYISVKIFLSTDSRASNIIRDYPDLFNFPFYRSKEFRENLNWSLINSFFNFAEFNFQICYSYERG